MNLQQTKHEKLSFVPSVIGSLVLFVGLGLSTVSAGDWFSSGIVSFVAYPVFFVSCVIASHVSLKINISKKWLSYSLLALIGSSMGFFGYLAVCKIVNLVGSESAFIFSGFITGIVMQYKIAVNKSLNTDAKKRRAC